MHRDNAVYNITKNVVYTPRLMPYISGNRSQGGAGIIKWLMKRATPLSRKNSEKIYQTLRLPRTGAGIELMKVTHGLSINDNYWVVKSSDYGKVRWSDINLYCNKLSDTLAYLAFTGTPISITGTELSAEFTGQGTYAKCICREEDGLVMYKAGSKFEITAEVLSAHIAQVLGIRTAPYWYTHKFGVEACATRILTNEKISWESAFNMTAFSEQSYHINIYDFAIKLFPVDFYRMVLLDGLTLNPDRHLQNWSFEIDGITNQILGLSPCYDCNKAFTADRRTMSREIPGNNLLRAARDAIEFAAIPKESIDNLFICCQKYPPEFGETLYNRLMYIIGRKENQGNCY